MGNHIGDMPRRSIIPWSRARSGLGVVRSFGHRVAVIGSGTLDILPHNGAVVTLLYLALCGTIRYRDGRHRRGYFGSGCSHFAGDCIWIVLKGNRPTAMFKFERLPNRNSNGIRNF
jgi:hypothetical protein